MNQIQEGIKEGAKTYFENETQGITDENKVKEGWENIKDTWDFLFSQAKIEDRDAPLQHVYLYDPTHPATTICLYIHSIESFARYQLNRASNYNDQRLIPTLGAWAAALDEIVATA